MKSEKDEVGTVPDKLRGNCSFEDARYHLYVVEKIYRGIERAAKKGTMNQKEVEGNSPDGLRSRIVPGRKYSKRTETREQV